MRRPPLIGFLLGLLFILILYIPPLLGFESDPPQESAVRDFLVWISTPVAMLTSLITGWKLQQEQAIFIYAFIAIPITVPLLGMLLGFLYSGAKSIMRKAR